MRIKWQFWQKLESVAKPKWDKGWKVWQHTTSVKKHDKYDKTWQVWHKVTSVAKQVTCYKVWQVWQNMASITNLDKCDKCENLDETWQV